MSEAMQASHGAGEDIAAPVVAESIVSPAASQPTAGELLRRAREATGLHVAALAVALKVPAKKLEALENNRWDLLPDAVFTRALAASVCRTLKTDAEPVLALMPGTPRRELTQDRGLDTPFKSPGEVPRAMAMAPAIVARWASRPLVLGVAGLLLGALALTYAPSWLPGVFKAGKDAALAQFAASGDTRSKEAPLQPAAITGGPLEDAAFGADAAAAMASGSAEAPAAAGHGAATLGANAALAVPGTGNLMAVAAPPSAPPAVANAAGAATAPEPFAQRDGEVLVFQATEPSWIAVTNARGGTVFKQLLNAGEVARVNAALPLTVVVGKADGTKVLVRGQAFDLLPLARENVARFEVK